MSTPLAPYHPRRCGSHHHRALSSLARRKVIDRGANDDAQHTPKRANAVFTQNDPKENVGRLPIHRSATVFQNDPFDERANHQTGPEILDAESH